PLYQPALPRCPNRSERGPVAARCQPSRIAVRQHAGSRREQRRRVRRHPAATPDLLPVDLARTRGGGGRSTPFAERPHGGDRCRPGAGEPSFSLVEVFAERRRERVAVGGGNADRRRASDGQRANRVGHVGGGTARELDLLVGESPLVEKNDAILLEADDSLWGQVLQDDTALRARTGV